MSLLDVVRYRLAVLLRPSSYARELDDEMQHHLALDALDDRDSRSDDAALRARRRFGNITYAAEERRMIAGLTVLDAARQDVRFVLRLLRRRAGFAAVTILTIALGIGAAVSIFSVTDAVLFRSLGFPDDDQLVTVWLTRPQWKTIPGLTKRWDRGPLSWPLFRDWRAATRSLAGVAVWERASALAGPPTAAEEVPVVRASASLFTVLGVKPVLGAWFTESENVAGGARAAVVSREMWETRFGGDEHILGRSVEIDGVAFTIVGVAPRGLSLDRSGTVAAYWIPAGQDRGDDERTSFAFQAIGRLGPGATLNAAAAEARRFFKSTPGDDRVTGAALATLRADQTRTVRRPLLLLLAAASLLLLIACVNVATLLMGEAQSRAHELRTRIALGAGRARLFRQLLTESLVLAGTGAAFGTVLAAVGVRLIVRSAPPSIPGLADVAVDARVLAVALAAAIVTGLLFGLAPALALVQSGHTLTAGSARHTARGRGRAQRVLIACEVALSMVLLVGAGLLVRSFQELSSVGFRPVNLLVASLRVPQSLLADSDRTRIVYAELIRRVQTRRGVTAVAATTLPPFSSGSSSGSFEVEGRPIVRGGPALVAQRRATTPGFFATAGIPILAGRSYDDGDRVGAPLVVVVSNALARSEWPSEHAIGKRIKFMGQWRTVIGVAGDIETERPSADPAETVYVPLAQLMLRSAPALLVRVADAGVEPAGDIRRFVRDVDERITVNRVDAMRDLVAASLADDRLRTMLIALFAAIAVVLAAIGTYGVAATAAVRRTREMAIRVAVGASTASIARLIVGSAAGGVALGAATGAVLAVVASRLLAPYLYRVPIGDPVVYAGVVVVLAFTTVGATWLPARRATQVRLTDTLAAE